MSRIVIALAIITIIYTPIFAQLGSNFPVYENQNTNLDVNGELGNLVRFGGGGVSMADFDQDGLDDLTVCTRNGDSLFFYRNLGNKFELVTPNYLPTETSDVKSVVWVDYDNDGDKDIFISKYAIYNRLYENDGNMNFTDVTVAVNLPTILNLNSYGANFGDINEDGYLDIYVSNYSNAATGGVANEMYKYNPITQTYQDITVSSNTFIGPSQSFCSAFFDYDMDGDIDLYVANDRDTTNILFENDGTGVFTDVSASTNSNLDVWAMNTGVGDYNNDGYWDIYVTNGNATVPSGINRSILLENNGGSSFSDVTVGSGTEFERFGWGGNWLDFDNDMDQDIYVCTSQPSAGNPMAMFVNQGDGTFTEPLKNTNGLGGEDDRLSYANGVIDADNNGLLDVVNPQHINSPFAVFINQGNPGNNFFKIDLVGVQSNKDAFGAIAEVWINGSKTIHQKFSANGYLSQPSDYLNIGIGTHTSVDSVVVYWPYGHNKNKYLGSNIKLGKMNQLKENTNAVTISDLIACINDHYVVYDPVPSSTFHGANFLHCESLIESGGNVNLKSDIEVDLDIGFEVQAGATFLGEIDNCSN